MRADHWKPPRLAWVFQSPSGGAAAAAREGLEEQLNLGFAFTSPLEVAVVKDTKPLRPRRSADDDGEGVKGAPPGHAAVEKELRLGWRLLRLRLPKLRPWRLLLMPLRLQPKRNPRALEKVVAGV